MIVSQDVITHVRKLNENLSSAVMFYTGEVCKLAFNA